jgi:hypothetical protein
VKTTDLTQTSVFAAGNRGRFRGCSSMAQTHVASRSTRRNRNRALETGSFVATPRRRMPHGPAQCPLNPLLHDQVPTRVKSILTTDSGTRLSRSSFVCLLLLSPGNMVARCSLPCHCTLVAHTAWLRNGDGPKLRTFLLRCHAVSQLFDSSRALICHARNLEIFA